MHSSRLCTLQVCQDPYPHHCFGIRAPTHHMGLLLLWPSHPGVHVPSRALVLHQEHQWWARVRWALCNTFLCAVPVWLLSSSSWCLSRATTPAIHLCRQNKFNEGHRRGVCVAWAASWSSLFSHFYSYPCLADICLSRQGSVASLCCFEQTVYYTSRVSSWRQYSTRCSLFKPGSNLCCFVFSESAKRLFCGHLQGITDIVYS